MFSIYTTCIIFISMISIILAGEKTIISSSENQKAVDITVYNDNFALVRDLREIDLDNGDGELRFQDVASYIMPATVFVKSISDPDKFTVKEQNYEYDLIDENKLLDKYVGKTIKIIDYNIFTDKKEIINAELLSNNNGQIFKIGNEIFIGHPGIRVLPQIPENLIARPTLMWLYSNSSKKPHEIEVSYLTDNISWKADYIFMLGKDDSHADLSGWVTMDNKSGATYKDAGLKLVAGEVNRIREYARKSYRTMMTKMEDAEPEAGGMFLEKPFFEYHLYTLPKKTTIKNNQSKQICLLHAPGVKTLKEFIVSTIGNPFTYRGSLKKNKVPVDVYMVFVNSKESGLGMPTPAGIVRVYKKDTDETQIFIGEDRIEHTPKDEEIKLKIGQAFDIVAERIQSNYERISSKLHESEWEITLRNRKEKTVKIGIIEKLQGDWKIIEKSHPYKRIDAFTVRFDVDIPSGKEVRVKYKVKVKL